MVRHTCDDQVGYVFGDSEPRSGERPRADVDRSTEGVGNHEGSSRKQKVAVAARKWGFSKRVTGSISTRLGGSGQTRLFMNKNILLFDFSSSSAVFSGIGHDWAHLAVVGLSQARF